MTTPNVPSKVSQCTLREATSADNDGLRALSHASPDSGALAMRLTFPIEPML